MSTERVVEFLHTVAGDVKLSESLQAAGNSTEGWLAAAKAAGYDFGESEFRTVAEEFVQAALPAGDFVPQLSASLFNDGGAFTAQAISRLKAVMQQGRYSGYYRPW